MTYTPRIDRRTAIAWVAAAGGAAAVGGLAFQNAGKEESGSDAALRSDIRQYVPVANGYGKDPDLANPKIGWPLIMTQEQLAATAILADLILPAEGKAPAPSAIGIPDFINEWISAPYADQQKDRSDAMQGFNLLANQARKRGGAAFSKLDGAAQKSLLRDMAAGANGLGAQGKIFFLLLRRLVLGGYYTTAEGYADIGYIGNVSLQAFPPPPGEVVSMVEARLQKLGL